ncbi:hypothetical protein CRG98_041999 [Punica granatum]|uniref:Uncharacterized protein n=1 Tax=Punica granatum TaxID=22663 RepID=A0A2I0I2L7_PUNGR|nr:hypothetical protein CRG98_041999 [Punica granatum]
MAVATTISFMHLLVLFLSISLIVPFIADSGVAELDGKVDAFPKQSHGSVYSLPDALALAFPHSDGKTPIIGQPYDKAKPLDVDASLSQLELDQKQERVEAEARSKGSYKSSISFSEHQFEKKRVKHKKIRQRCDDIEKGKKRSRKCEIDDDELLVSAIIKNKENLPHYTNLRAGPAGLKMGVGPATCQHGTPAGRDPRGGTARGVRGELEQASAHTACSF